ncbi:MAG: DUF2723 domain-containing protein [Chloroflexota bacterium]
MQRQTWIKQLPILATGLFAGRVFSEAWPAPVSPSFAILSTGAALALSFWLLRKRPFSKIWPLLILAIYIVAPTIEPRLAITAVLLTLFTILQTHSFLRSAWEPLKPALRGASESRRADEKRDHGDRGHELVINRWVWFLPIPLFFILYVITLAPDVLTADNAEFQLIATNLGVAHPPGFSLYTVLGHLFSKLPIGPTPAYRLNLFSALTSTLTLWLVQASVWRLTKSRVAGLTAVLALGTATTFWAQATTANIRSLTGLFAALVIYWLIRFYQTEMPSLWRDGISSRFGDPASKNARPLKNTLSPVLVLAALSLSLGITHHASLVFMGLLWIAFVFVAKPSLLTQPRQWITPIVAGLAGLLPLLYLPLRGLAVQNGATIRGASAGLATWDGFWNHALALGFRGDFFYFITPADLWARFGVMGNVMTFQFSGWLLLGMGVGFVWLLWKERNLFLLLALPFLLHTFITATYRAPQTVEYMLPAYVPAVIMLGVGVKWVTSGKWQVAGKVIVAVLLTAVFWQGYDHYTSYAQLAQQAAARDTVQPLLEQAPADSTILAHWHWATPLWYLQEVEGMRPDVKVRFVFPTNEAYEATWARRVGEELANGRSVITTHYDPAAYAQLPPPEPLNDAFLFPQAPRMALPDGFTQIDISLADTLNAVGYAKTEAIEIGQETVFTLAWQPIPNPQSPIDQLPIPIFAHLVDENGRLHAQDDLTVIPQPEGLTLTQFRLTPRIGAAPGTYQILLGIANANPIREEVATLNVTTMSRPLYTNNPTYQTVPSGRPLLRLVGYDWDHTLPNQPRLYLHWQTEQGYQTEVRDGVRESELPTHEGAWGVFSKQLTVNIEPSRAVTVYCSLFTVHCPKHYVPFAQGIIWSQSPISTLQSQIDQSPNLQFHSSDPLTTDLVISTRLIGYEEDGIHWAWWELDDSIPAMGGIPTLKWITGSRVVSPHRMAFGETAVNGQKLATTLRLYDAFTNRPVPILDDRLAPIGWVVLGEGEKRP